MTQSKTCLTISSPSPTPRLVPTTCFPQRLLPGVQRTEPLDNQALIGKCPFS